MIKTIVRMAALIIGALAALVISGFMLMGAMLAGEFPPPPSRRKVIGEFTKNKAHLDEVKDYFLSTGFEDISIDINSADNIGYMSIYPIDGVLHKLVAIDASIEETINYVTSVCKYSHIGRNGNTVYFQRWAGLKYKSKGIAFAIDGGPLELEDLVRQELLGEANWHYYETNYAETRNKRAEAPGN
jgi:hypothetical protein